MTDRITPNVIENIEKLLMDNREGYDIPNNIRLFIVDTLAVPEQNLLIAIRQLCTGRRITKQEVYEQIMREIHQICEPKIIPFSARGYE